METIGDLIKAKRKKLQLSAKRLADLLGQGITEENIYKWENGSTPQKPQWYAAVVNWLNAETGIKVAPDHLGRVIVTEVPPSANKYADDLIQSLKDQVAFLKDQVRADLARSQASLNGLSDDIADARVTQRAILEYNLLKESKGDPKKVEILKEQINKLIAQQLDEKRADNGAISNTTNKT